MAQATYANDWKAAPPRRPALAVGSTFVSLLGCRSYLRRYGINVKDVN